MSATVVAETVRRHVVNPLYLLYALAVISIAAITAGFGAPPGMWHPFIAIVVLAAGAQLIGPEFSTGTLQLILAKPVNRSVYLLSRYAGVILSIWIFIAAALVAELTGHLLSSAPDPGWKRTFLSTANLSLEALLVCAVLAFFGSCFRSYVNLFLYFALQGILGIAEAATNEIRTDMPGSIGMLARFFAHHPVIGGTLAFLGENLFPARLPGVFDQKWVILILANSAAMLLAACLVFRRREVPYGGD